MKLGLALATALLAACSSPSRSVPANNTASAKRKLPENLSEALVIWPELKTQMKPWELSFFDIKLRFRKKLEACIAGRVKTAGDVAMYTKWKRIDGNQWEATGDVMLRRVHDSKFTDEELTLIRTCAAGIWVGWRRPNDDPDEDRAAHGGPIINGAIMWSFPVENDQLYRP